MPIAANFTSILNKDFEINFTQCLPSGSLKYTELCNLLQLTAAEHAEMGGISFSDMQEFDQAWVLSRMRVEINALPKWKDTVTVKTWINSLENSRSVRALEMYVNGKKIVGCETFWAVFNTKTRRPELLSLTHDHFKLFPEIKATQEGFSKIDINPEKEEIFSKTVILSDLDIVNHVNNVKYLEWCMDLVDENIILKQKIKSFEMNFMKELSLRDQVVIHENVSDDCIVFSITKEDKNCYALQLNLK
ncbi:Acyl-ACP thioesterase [Flavobacterium glycines]|uniref:Acyl-ACP thioesterase n=1 Tax=Flavobacterium glycines TaxID=551990 RepID=A0A1B9DZE4_9FLAO|nr:acyl-ACP thioesterase domain-containing protein [Flavobacterium glycines]OCB75050.1 acyl-ACP thioesterase [Flavobacterium glycines]GEL11347.1 acyl-ACP thioesterase [Flavobacterium glycines]SDJ40818.1 Acyl-ACP thioesterase [Flavobacterium glycines]